MKLFEFEVRWARVVGRTVVPRGVLGGATDDLDAGELLREDCAAGPGPAALGMRAALWLTWFAPFWMSFRFRTFGSLDEAARAALLERLLKAKTYLVRMAVMLLKITFCTLLLGDRRALLAMRTYDFPELPPLAPRDALADEAQAK